MNVDLKKLKELALDLFGTDYDDETPFGKSVVRRAMREREERNKMKKVAIVCSLKSHFDHVVRVMQPMNRSCVFIHVWSKHLARAVVFDMAIEYCHHLWLRTLKNDFEEMAYQFKRRKTEVKIISEITEPFTLVNNTK